MQSSSSSKRQDPADGLGQPEKKRRKGGTRLSCAECRRLKLRCDRSIPCGSCVKRGCSAICPEGSLTTGAGNRFVLASTQDLHAKIQELAIRVRELEDALRLSHQRLSADPHPLLSEELLKIKAPLQREVPTDTQNAPASKEDEHNPEMVDAFGSLSISMTGRSRYFGHTAGSNYFLQNEDSNDEEAEHIIDLKAILPEAILIQASAFPIAHFPDTSASRDAANLGKLGYYLPTSDKAYHLRNMYYQYAAWMYNPISSDNFDRTVYAQFYPSAYRSDAPSPHPLSQTLDIGDPRNTPQISHRLGLMYIVLAIGSLMDPAQPAYGIEAEKYHQLARASLFQTPLFHEPSVQGVQTLFLMAFYLFLGDRHGQPSGSRWALMGLAIKLAQSIGLHRDTGRWNVDAEETSVRRQLYWELYTYDSWQCLTFGRPPSFNLLHADTKMPHPTPTEASDENSFHAWKHRFTSECMSLLHDQAFGAKTPTYATILQLERKVRPFPVPPVMQVAGFGSSEPRNGGFPDSASLALQRHVVLAIREANLLYLHRSFFARAVSDHPKDPLGSPYGSSVLAAYRSAGSLVALMRNLHTQLKEQAERIWFLWTHMFSCTIVLGSIVTRCPSMSLAPSALGQLDSACELFAKAARGFRAQKVLSIMLGLQKKAHASLDDFRKGKGSPKARPGVISDSISPIDDDDELATLGGKTRLVAVKEITASPSPPQYLERSPPLNHVPLPLSPSIDPHPNVVAYLNFFQQQQQQQQQQAQQHHLPRQQQPTASFADVAIYHGIQSQYQQPEPTYQVLQQPLHIPHHQMNNGSGSGHTPFPSAFPVYDYGHSTGYPIMDEMQVPNGRHPSDSPPREANLQTTWNDFIGDLL